MDIWLPIITALIAVLGAGAVYTYQKQVDRTTALIEARRTCYKELLISLQTELIVKSNDSFIEYQKRRSETFLLASDNVAKKMGNFITEVNLDLKEKSNKSANATLIAYAAMVRAMRDDCFEKTALTDEEILAAMPVKHERTPKD